jgi:hypothetical protein
MYVSIPIIAIPAMTSSGVRKMKFVVEESVGEGQPETALLTLTSVIMECATRLPIAVKLNPKPTVLPVMIISTAPLMTNVQVGCAEGLPETALLTLTSVTTGCATRLPIPVKLNPKPMALPVMMGCSAQFPINVQVGYVMLVLLWIVRQRVISVTTGCATRLPIPVKLSPRPMALPVMTPSTAQLMTNVQVGYVMLVLRGIVQQRVISVTTEYVMII